MEKREKLVVVGGGLSGVAFLDELFKLDHRRYDITVFAGEKYFNYNRVLLSQVLTGEKSVEEISLHDRRWYEEKGVRLFTGTKALEIKRGSKTVIAEGGVSVPYNKLVLATGSLPSVPPIEGIEKKGVVSFRNMEDCERIKALAGEGVTRAIILGGGLLGLEAAWGLKRIGLDVAVVHLVDRLMERQLDTVSAAFLKEDLERAGIEVLLNKKVVSVTGDERVEGVRFSDGEVLKGGLVVVSTGIRPNTGLAAASGVYCNRGVVVSDTMQTYDPAVFAIGECVEWRGMTFGLVSSVFEQARVLASHLAGDSRLVFRNKPASVTLKVPGINLYTAGTPSAGPDTETIEYVDRGERVYKKLYIRDRRLAGIILYGDSTGGPSLFSYLADEADISDKRKRLLLGDGGAPSIEDLPADAIVCGCNGVTKGAIVEAITKKGLFTREDVKRETKASSSCGGCATLVDRILEATLGGNFKGTGLPESICACTKYSRDDIIKNIREKGLKSVQDVMDTLGWETVGCETCRPAINYYLQMVWPASAEDDPSSRLINERVHANIQRDGKFSVVPRVYGGVVRPEELRRIAFVAEKYSVPLVKITGGQRIGLFGIEKDALPYVWKDLGMPSGYAYGKALRTVKTCVGSAWCRYGTQDSLSLGIRLEKMLEGLWMPAKVKLGVDGCPRNCAESEVKDVGITGVAGGFKVFVGGCGGIELKGGELLCTLKTEDEVVEVVSAFIQRYREDALYGERTFKWVGRIGLKAIRTVLEDAEERRKLSARLAKTLEGRRDPWEKRTSFLRELDSTGS